MDYKKFLKTVDVWWKKAGAANEVIVFAAADDSLKFWYAYYDSDADKLEFIVPTAGYLTYDLLAVYDIEFLVEYVHDSLINMPLSIRELASGFRKAKYDN